MEELMKISKKTEYGFKMIYVRKEAIEEMSATDLLKELGVEVL
jgi:hypothetical protein